MKIKILFVGSFKQTAKDGSVGGQMYACKSLLDSSLSDYVDWILLDTTGESVPPPPVFIRSFFAFKRLIKFIFLIIFKKPDYALIFSANGPSIYEKGVMLIFANFFNVKTILAPRGGPLVNDVAKSKFAKKFVKLIISKSDIVICQGAFWRSFFSNLIGNPDEQKFLVLPNWIDLNKYSDNNLYRWGDSKTLNKPNITILYMGWIQEDKGVFDIFEAIQSPELSYINIKMIFLGDGPGKNELKKKMSLLNSTNFSVEFPGWVHGDKKNDYLANADIFILASYSEGMPNSLMEAMASGIPTIATNVGAVSELIRNEETGILINVNSPNEIVNGIRFYIDNPNKRDEIISNARLLIEANHTVQNAARKLRMAIN